MAYRKQEKLLENYSKSKIVYREPFHKKPVYFVLLGNGSVYCISELNYRFKQSKSCKLRATDVSEAFFKEANKYLQRKYNERNI